MELSLSVLSGKKMDLQVHGFLRSKSWETRIAAGIALESVAKNMTWEYSGGSTLPLLVACHVQFWLWQCSVLLEE